MVLELGIHVNRRLVAVTACCIESNCPNVNQFILAVET